MCVAYVAGIVRFFLFFLRKKEKLKHTEYKEKKERKVYLRLEQDTEHAASLFHSVHKKNIHLNKRVSTFP